MNTEHPIPLTISPTQPAAGPRRVPCTKDIIKKIAWAALLNAVLFALVLSFTTPTYETNDDLGMQLISSGMFTGHPSEYLIFTNVLVGCVLRAAYDLSDGINWYFYYLIAVHYASLTAIAYLVLGRKPNWRQIALYVGFFLVAELRILLLLQFTTTAFLSGMAGTLLLITGLRPSSQVAWARVIVGFAFLALMIMIREAVALLLVPIALPFLIEQLGGKNWRRAIVPATICCSLFLALHGLDRWYYRRDRAWADFIEYNAIRGEIHRTRLEHYLPQAGPKIGWSKNDGQMFSDFYFSDPEVYGDTAKLRLLVNELKTRAHDDPASGSTFSIRRLYLPNMLYGTTRTGFKVAILSALWCMLLAKAFGRRQVITLISSYCVFVFLGIYLLGTSRLPERVAYNMVLFVNIICLYWVAEFASPVGATPGSGRLIDGLKALRIIRPLVPGVVTLLAWFYLFAIAEFAQQLRYVAAYGPKMKAISQRILAPLETLASPGQKALIVPMPHDSVLEQCLFFYSSPKALPFALVPSGWFTHSPLFQTVLNQQGLRPYSPSLVNRPGTFFLMDKRWLRPLTEFYQEHYALEVRFDKVLNTDELPAYADCSLHLYVARSIANTVSTAP